VADLSPLRGLAALQSLYLSGTRVADLSPLAGLVELRHVSLPSTFPFEARRAFDESRRSRGLRPLVSQ